MVRYADKFRNFETKPRFAKRFRRTTGRFRSCEKRSMNISPVYKTRTARGLQIVNCVFRVIPIEFRVHLQVMERHMLDSNFWTLNSVNSCSRTVRQIVLLLYRNSVLSQLRWSYVYEYYTRNGSTSRPEERGEAAWARTSNRFGAGQVYRVLFLI